AAGMYGHPAMFNPAAYPYMLPMMNSAPHTPVSNAMSNNYLQQQQQLVQQQGSQQDQQQSTDNDAQAHASPRVTISEAHSPSSIGQVEVQ
ncbi:15119_t:CDS:1, partial [Acaulospora colombiana]